MDNNYDIKNTCINLQLRLDEDPPASAKGSLSAEVQCDVRPVL